METQEHLNHLSEIRALMERSSRCLSLSGLSGVAAGLIAILCGSYVWWYLGKGYFVSPVEVSNCFLALPVDSNIFRHVVLVAALTLVLAVGAAFFFTLKNSKKKNLKIWDASTKYFLINLFLPLLAGGVFCLALVYHGELYLLASSTLVFYGLALLNASRYTHREIRYLGISEVGLGLISLFFIGYGILFWMLGFGILHMIYGLMMYQKHEKN
ncbi:hypothetical protein [Carboxylicivirga taeanensis]|uniref:hypothetical protein n=1 Tax=Carboxylicivirga taeanensis TaxID=1416875 RepID=UPI003F6DAB0F